MIFFNIQLNALQEKIFQINVLHNINTLPFKIWNIIIISKLINMNVARHYDILIQLTWYLMTISCSTQNYNKINFTAQRHYVICRWLMTVQPLSKMILFIHFRDKYIQLSKYIKPVRFECYYEYSYYIIILDYTSHLV